MWVRVKAALLRSKAELIIGLYSLGYYMPITFIQNLLIEKICLQHYPTESCLNGKVNKTIEDAIQGTVSQYLLYYYLMMQVPAVILALFMGHWSDVYGRKFIINLSVFGAIFYFILLLLNNYLTYWGPMLIIISAVPFGLTGGYPGFMLGIFGYIKDVNSLDTLSMRISMADGIEMLGMEIGPLIGGQLFVHYGYIAVFTICIAFLVIDMICIQVFIDDSQFQKAHFNTMVKDFFSLSGFVSCLKSVVKRREGNRRLYILFVMLSAMLILTPYSGLTDIMYLFTRLKLQWDVLMMNYYNMALGGSKAIGLLILMPVLIKFFHLTDTSMGILGQVSYMVFYIATAFVSTTTAMYSVCLLNIVSTMSNVTFRSLISKCISSSDVGQVMAVYAVLQALSLNLGQIFATQVYTHTYLVFPGAFFVCCGSIISISVLIYIWIHWDLKRQNLTLEKENGDTNSLTSETAF